MKQLPLKFKRNYRREAEEFYLLRKSSPIEVLFPLCESVDWFERTLKENPAKKFVLDEEGYYIMIERGEE